MKVSDNAKASFMRELSDLLERHPWAAFSYTTADDGVYVHNQLGRDWWCIGFSGCQADEARRIATELTDKASLAN
jgi:hypothetical protein